MLELTTRIIAFENDDLDHDETVDLFQDLLDSGMLWHLQGYYQRTAMNMLEEGLITERTTTAKTA